MKGVYILLVEVIDEVTLRVGHLGEVSFKPGLYVYVGSAQNNLEKRVSRHFSKEKKIRWHIDYLLSSRSCKPLKAIAYSLKREYECIISNLLLEIGGNPVRRFGSTDCKCFSHLYKIEEFEEIKKKIEESLKVKPIFTHS
ncbi:MAG: GIY-YIG nuclease family protein [Nitrososphaerota archaeon]